VARKPKNARSPGPVNRPQVVRRNVLTPSERADFEYSKYRGTVTPAEAKSFEVRSLSQARGGTVKPKGQATMTPSEAKDFESRSLNRARGGTNKPTNKPTLTPSERKDFESKSLKQSRVNPKVTPTPKPAPAPVARAAASTVGKRGLGRLAAGVLGRLAGPVGIGWALGEAVKDTSLARKAQGAVTNAAASLTGLAAKERAAMGSMSMKVSPRKTTAAPAPSTPSVPPKPVMQSTSTPTSSPAPKMAPKPLQKATGASKSRGKAMSGAELANFIGLPQNNAVRTYMETGKHKYPSGKK